MTEKGIISGPQMALLIHPTIVATAVLLVSGVTGELAQKDMWLSPIWGSLAGFFTFFVVHKLNQYHPKETIIEFVGKIIGSIPGKIMGVIILIAMWQDTGIVLKEYAEFVKGSIIPKTPEFIIVGSMMFICAMAVHGGLEVMARCAQIFLPVLIGLFLLLNILLIPDLDINNMLPVFENGIAPSLKGAAVPASWFGLFFLLSFILPYVGKKEKKMKWGMIAVVTVALLIVIGNLTSLLLFGSMVAKPTHPFFSAVRYISIGDFIQHIESIFVGIWVTAMFIKISVYFYAVVIGTTQMLRLSDYRSIVFPMAFLSVLASYWSASNLQELSYFLGSTWSLFTSIVYIIFPAFLLLLVVIRRQLNNDLDG